MDLRAAIRNFVEQAKQLGLQLRSHEAATLSKVDLHILEVQLYLLEKEVQRRKETNRVDTSSDPKRNKPDFPPYLSDKDDEGEHTPP